MECQPALHYHSPTATERGTKPVTEERSAELSDEFSAVDAELQNRQLLSLRRSTSLTHQRPYEPRLRTTETGMTWSVPSQMCDTCSRWRRRLDVDPRTSVFAVFSWSRLECIHLATSSMQVEMMFCSSSVADGRQSP